MSNCSNDHAITIVLQAPEKRCEICGCKLLLDECLICHPPPPQTCDKCGRHYKTLYPYDIDTEKGNIRVYLCEYCLDDYHDPMGLVKFIHLIRAQNKKE